MEIELSQLQPETSVTVRVFDPRAARGSFTEGMTAGWLRAMLTGDPGFRADVLDAEIRYPGGMVARVLMDA